jgi:hypothetical protein
MLNVKVRPQSPRRFRHDGKAGPTICDYVGLTPQPRRELILAFLPWRRTEAKPKPTTTEAPTP